MSDPSPPYSRWNDPAFLAHDQYATSANLEARMSLHAKYSTSSVSWLSWLHDQIEWGDARDVLDVGAGTGNFWRALPQPLDADLTLCDISTGMLRVAEAAAAEHAHSVRAVEASVEQLPFEDASFDVVLANHMLYHAPDIPRAIAELRRVLRDDGHLVASTIGPSHLREIKEIGRSVFGGRSRATGELFGPVDGLAYLEHDFAHVEWRLFDDALLCTDPDDVLTYITSVVPDDRVTADHRRALREEFDRRRRPDGLHVTKETGVFLASGLR